MDGKVSGDTKTEKTKLALDTDKGTALAVGCVFLFLTIGLIWQIRHLVGHIRTVQYKPFDAKVDLTSVSAVLDTIAPFIMLWLVWSYWRFADNLERATAVLFILESAAGIFLRNVELGYTVRYSLSGCTHLLGLVVLVMIIGIIIRWFRSIIRYV
jgi:hypothetical protein